MHRALVPLAVLALALAPHVARADDAPAAPAAPTAPAAPSSAGQGVGLSSELPNIQDSTEARVESASHRSSTAASSTSDSLGSG